jgi:hypothetical protein
MSRRRQHFLVILMTLLCLGPIMLVAGGVAAMALLSELSGFFQIPTTFLPTGTVLDFAVAGWGASRGSFANYVSFMVGGVIAAGCMGGIKWALGSER